MWTNDYIGLPFKPNGRDRMGLDCWGLVRLVYAERLGTELPIYDGIFERDDRQALQDVAAVMDRERAQWQLVETPGLFDVLLMRIYGRMVSHVGIYDGNGGMLHIMRGTDSIVERLDTARWRNRVMGVYRHADCR